jgi:hypothetical protein
MGAFPHFEVSFHFLVDHLLYGRLICGHFRASRFRADSDLDLILKSFEALKFLSQLKIDQIFPALN